MLVYPRHPSALKKKNYLSLILSPAKMENCYKSTIYTRTTPLSSLRRSTPTRRRAYFRPYPYRNARKIAAYELLITRFFLSTSSSRSAHSGSAQPWEIASSCSRRSNARNELIFPHARARALRVPCTFLICIRERRTRAHSCEERERAVGSREARARSEKSATRRGEDVRRTKQKMRERKKREKRSIYKSIESIYCECVKRRKEFCVSVGVYIRLLRNRKFSMYNVVSVY